MVREKISRRKALKTTGTALAAVSLPFEAAVGDEPEQGEVLVMKRPVNRPLSLTEVNKVRSEFVRNHIDVDQKSLPKLEVGSKRDLDVFAVVVKVDPDGVRSSYIGSIPSDTETREQDVQRLHRHADNYKNTVEFSARNAFDKSPTVVPNNISTARAGDPSYHWDHIDSGYHEVSDHPRGVLYLSADAYEYPDDPNYVVFACDETYRASPGVQEWDTDGHYWRGTSNHNYSREYEAGDPTLHDYGPSGDKEGNYDVSFELGYGSGGISVDYDPPSMYRTDNTSQSSAAPSWEWEPLTEDRDQIAEFNPGSIIKSSSSPSSGDTLFSVDAMGRFGPYNGDDTENISTYLRYTY